MRPPAQPSPARLYLPGRVTVAPGRGAFLPRNPRDVPRGFRKLHSIITAALLALAFGCTAAAQSASRQADLSHGSVIAAQGTPNGIPACALCHAFDGAADGSGAFPRIAGLSAYYFEKQMRDFASGVRDNAIMSPLAKPLSADDIADVAAYYAGAKAPFPPLAGPAPALIARGEKLAKMGDAAKGIPACNICHGPRGAGETTPYLAGQYAQYIDFALQMWRRGYRKNSQDIMLIFANKLDDQDIAAVAAYYQQLPTQRVRDKQ